MTSQFYVSVDEELKSIAKRLDSLEREQETLIERRDVLTRYISSKQACSPTSEINFSTNRKVEIFIGLFKGRSDIHAIRWQNSKGRCGYSVACRNEWVQGVCHKPKVKCGECSSRNYREIDEEVVYKHLSGKHVVGLYPLLKDNTCYLLAADFDKTGWQEVIKAMMQACVVLEIPHSVEISRSGNGAHLWIFFSEPVSAKDARLLGFHLLDKAMEIYPNLSFESYDRLFPNQDIMPEGGFGNLIALPLQYQARQQGNSEFVDEQLIPYPDQWGYLSQINRISAQRLDGLLTLIKAKNPAENDEELPWELGLATKQSRIDGCPEQVTIVLANHIFIKYEELPSAVTTRLKRLASFSNPVFFKTQALRFSTHGIPRYITCARFEQGYLLLPRGCLDAATELLMEHKIEVLIDDKRQLGKKLKQLKFVGKLRKDQTRAVNVITKHHTGVLHAPTAFGKTVVAIGIITKRRVNTLILTHSRQLLEQWQERLTSFLENVEIGVISGGKKNPSGQIDVATYQSLINKKDNSVMLDIQKYGQIIIDECHHISAPRFEMVLNEVRAKFVLGLTATPERQDGHQKIIFMLAGPIRHKIKPDHSTKFQQTVVAAQLYSQPPISLLDSDSRPRISDVYRWLAEDARRNQRIIDDVTTGVLEEKHTLLLTERRDHAELLNQLLIDKDIKTVVLRGAMRAKERREANEQLACAQVIVATGRYVGEGFDLPRLDTLFLALPISWKGSLAQYAGRIHRESEGKERVTIFDYIDTSLPMLQRMFKKREKGYKAMGYNVTYSSRSSSEMVELDIS